VKVLFYLPFEIVFYTRRFASERKVSYIAYSPDLTRNRWAEFFFTLIEIFLSVYNKLLLINDDLSRRCGQKGGGDYGDVSPVPLGSKEPHDPPVVEG
jgi:hypothetical protein